MKSLITAEVIAIARRALAELAGADLEERMLAGELLPAIEDVRAAGSVDAICLARNSPLAEGSYKPILTRLLPLDAQWQASLSAARADSQLPLHPRAEENIATLLAGLTGHFHRLRQASIEEELFEVVSGYEALTPGVSVEDCGKSVAPCGHSGEYRLETRLP